MHLTYMPKARGSQHDLVPIARPLDQCGRNMWLIQTLSQQMTISAFVTRMATLDCPSLLDKWISPHTLRHTAAMDLLRSGVGCAVIAFWLGHESVETTRVYLHANLEIKKCAMDQTRPTDVPKGVYKPDDAYSPGFAPYRSVPSRAEGVEDGLTITSLRQAWIQSRVMGLDKACCDACFMPTNMM